MGPPEDPKRLVAEAYRMEGIGEAECRSILLDWALSLDGPSDAAARRLLARAREEGCPPEHPMTALLRAAAEGAPPARRRGGRRARLALTEGTGGGPDGEQER
jgi:hypothetical protein